MFYVIFFQGNLTGKERVYFRRPSQVSARIMWKRAWVIFFSTSHVTNDKFTLNLRFAALKRKRKGGQISLLQGCKKSGLERQLRYTEESRGSDISKFVASQTREKQNTRRYKSKKKFRRGRKWKWNYILTFRHVCYKLFLLLLFFSAGNRKNESLKGMKNEKCVRSLDF